MAGQVWSVNTLGGYSYSLELSDTLRTAVQPLVKFRQLADAKDFTDHGKHRGQTVTWDEWSDVSAAGGVLTETSTIPETNITVSQGTGTIAEYGNAVPYTGFLDDMSKQPIEEIIRKTLKNDAKKVLDQAAYNAFKTTPLRVVALAGTDTQAIVLTTNGTATTTNNVAFGKNHVKSIVDTMKERNIPPYFMDDYLAIGHPTSFRQMKNDLESVHQYTDQGFNMILNGEIGRYEGVRFIEQTNIAKENWVNSKSNQIIFCGEDTVAEIVVTPEEIRGKLPSDYGRSRGVAWYYEGGFSLMHPNQLQARVVKWDSAA